MSYIIKSSPEDYLASHHYISDENGSRTTIMILLTGDMTICYDKDMPITILHDIALAYAFHNCDIAAPASDNLSFHDCLDIALNHQERSMRYCITDNNEGIITFKLFACCVDRWEDAFTCELDIIENKYSIIENSYANLCDWEDTVHDICSDILDNYGQNFDHLSIEPYIHKAMKDYYNGKYEQKNRD